MKGLDERFDLGRHHHSLRRRIATPNLEVHSVRGLKGTVGTAPKGLKFFLMPQRLQCCIDFLRREWETQAGPLRQHLRGMRQVASAQSPSNELASTGSFDTVALSVPDTILVAETLLQALPQLLATDGLLVQGDANNFLCFLQVHTGICVGAH